MRNPYDYYITPEEYEAAAKNGISNELLTRRIRNLGWDKEIAMTKPSRYNANRWKNIKEIALKNGISHSTYTARIKKGWRLIDAISKPPIDKYQALKLAEQVNSKCKNKVLTDGQAEQAELNGISYNTARDRVKRLKWTVEEAITTPVLTRSECGKKAKEASPWSKLVIPSREEIMKRRKLTYIAN
ncbi:hypothetical protein U0X57_05630 [Bacillus thuringiensis]|uniref:hypothetical protein n=1 Tax=Bacillus cereus group TaxID=86661 RepID=UPI0002B40569|nr:MULTISPECIES: hypothetical protein [Bacillus cereus group]AGE76910.1 hypothetical protein HD73_1332 [Bacillus thuringiensis serovar kurstaki str. HD73]AHZ50067.1 hypothetical protein YBT1520_06625 [Bacillus thuringiensis serovar kurstaki str. YBT-1520]AIM33342.1 hypothetical protein DF16_orf04927 [Bacillus thuringiensis serovar kurstaki str. YBT-1520]AJK43371.1 PVL ORF-50-like family protein [Bacillus thuringiensis serovar kurstaki]AKJ58164.1 hypothetical protein XI92_07495 [Bacillus thurin